MSCRNHSKEKLRRTKNGRSVGCVQLPALDMPQHRAAPARPDPADEAVAALKHSLAGSLSRVSDLFKTWDTDGNGMIDKFEFRRVVAELGLPNSDAASDRLFDEYDKDGSGEIQYVEYVRQSLRESLASSASRVTDLLRRWDVRDDPRSSPQPTAVPAAEVHAVLARSPCAPRWTTPGLSTRRSFPRRSGAWASTPPGLTWTGYSTRWTWTAPASSSSKS